MAAFGNFRLSAQAGSGSCPRLPQQYNSAVRRSGAGRRSLRAGQCLRPSDQAQFQRQALLSLGLCQWMQHLCRRSERVQRRPRRHLHPASARTGRGICRQIDPESVLSSSSVQIMPIPQAFLKMVCGIFYSYRFCFPLSSRHARRSFFLSPIGSID